ncbi:Rtr1/RPAP2 family-domain-containing protein [Gaertneriomyces semiglobifer]|nr:Rtr1/RPAP2 family-domain-containing protein [Gaertneriomyces semiglobifer]
MKVADTVRADWDKKVFVTQERLFDGAVEPKILAQAARFLTPRSYDDVIVERVADKQCGYPLCSKSLLTTKGKFRISPREKKVYDASALKNYCSAKCMACSDFFRSQLSDEPGYLRDQSVDHPIEVISPDTTLEDMERRLYPSPSILTQQELLTDYVQSMLSELPRVSVDHRIVRENIIEASPSEPAATATSASSSKVNGQDYDAIEGYNIKFQRVPEPTKLKSSELSPTPVSKSHSNHEEPASKGKIKPSAAHGLANGPSEEIVAGAIQVSERNVREIAAPHRPKHTSAASCASTVVERAVVCPPEDRGFTSSRPSAGTGMAKVRSGHAPTAACNSSDPDSEGYGFDPVPIPRGELTLSLFGRVFTVLGRMVTDHTKAYLRRAPGASLDLAVTEDESGRIRKEIFGEQLIRTFRAMRRDYRISIPFDDDIINLVQTLSLTQNGVVLSSSEQWLICTVFLKVLSIRDDQFAQEMNSANKWPVILEHVGASTEELETYVSLFR